MGTPDHTSSLPRPGPGSAHPRRYHPRKSGDSPECRQNLHRRTAPVGSLRQSMAGRRDSASRAERGRDGR